MTEDETRRAKIRFSGFVVNSDQGEGCNLIKLDEGDPAYIQAAPQVRTDRGHEFWNQNEPVTQVK